MIWSKANDLTKWLQPKDIVSQDGTQLSHILRDTMSTYLYKVPEGLSPRVTSSVSSESLYCCCAGGSLTGSGAIGGGAGIPTRSNSSNTLYRGYRCQRARNVDWEVVKFYCFFFHIWRSRNIKFCLLRI